MPDMREVSFEAGQTIFREGEQAESVYLLRSGEVEVVRQSERDEVRIAVIGEGELFGEIAVIRGQTRSTTLRALGPASALEIPRADFLKAFPDDNPLTLKILRTLCGRLLDTNDMMMDLRSQKGIAEDDLRRIRLLPDSDEVAAQIGRDGLIVGEFPFEVGCHDLPGQKPSQSAQGLTLRHTASHHLETRQFVLEFHRGRLHLRDLASRLGTLVNDTRVAHFEDSTSIPLEFGESRIRTGGTDSPYRFRLLVEG